MHILRHSNTKKIVQLLEANVMALFVLSLFLLSFISVWAGTDPRLRVYVFAESSTVTLIKEKVTGYGKLGITVFDPDDEFNEIGILARVGFIDVAVIGDWQIEYTSVLDALRLVQRIYVLRGYSESLLGRFVLEEFHRSIPIKILSLDEIGEVLASEARVHAIMYGHTLFEYSYLRFKMFAKLISLMTLLVISCGTALIFCEAYSIRNSKWYSNLSHLICTGFFVMLISQVFFTICSCILRIPLGLHANSSSQHVTLISFLGPFGGGTFPRFFAALVGFLLFLSGSSILDKKEKTLLAIVSITIGFLIIMYPETPVRTIMRYGSPVDILFSSTFGALSKTIASAHSPNTFYRSRSVLLFFAGTSPLILLRGVNNIVKGQILIVSAILISRGYASVGSMALYHTYAGVIPGLMCSYVLLALFWLEDMIIRRVAQVFTKSMT